MEPTENEYRQKRLDNMRKLEAQGCKPFGGAFSRTGRLAEVRAAFQEDRRVSVAGRIMSIRDMGKTIFCHISDGTDRFQLFAQQKSMGEQAFGLFKHLDTGDHIGAEGGLFTTKTGEQTLRIEKWVILSKALLPLPEKWHGLRDVEARYRQRYLDLTSNQDVRKLFDKRIQVIREIRGFLDERGFSEVETPMMQPQAGGAAARPFVTRYEALDCDMYLRIAPELYLKRLLVGGFDKVYELNRNFRNEGLDRTHNCEFTMLEIYEAYSDVHGMKKLVQDMIVHVATTVFGSLKFTHEGQELDLSLPWREITYNDLIKKKMGDDWFGLPPAEAAGRAAKLGLEIEQDWTMCQITHEIYEKTIERTLVSPTFVTRLPAELIPLAKRCEDDPSVADVFELEICGREIAPAYSELNDPIEQRRRLEAQAGADSAQVDEDFVTALEHGMPPAGGMGVGIDRLIMVLTGMDAIREVILFPQLRRRTGAGPD